MRMMMSSLFLTACLQLVGLASPLQQKVVTNAELGALFQASLDSVGQGQRMEFENLWVHALVKRYPELSWYAQGGVAASQEGEAKKRPDSFSVRMFGEYYPEFDRTLMVLKCYFLIKSGSPRAYDVFVGPQKEDRLTREHFDRLHERFVSVGNMDASLAALVLGDIGKIDMMHEWMQRYGIKDHDHDVFYGSIMLCPEAREALPSFSNLSPKAQALLIKTANFGHWGHITHLEGGVAMFEPLKDSGILETDFGAFVFESVVHTSDVAGAGGHRNTRGSLVYNNNTFWTLERVYAACLLLPEYGKSYAYRFYLEERARRVNLTTQGTEREVLGRLVAMLRLYEPEEGKALEEAARAWSPEERALIFKTLSIAGANQLPETPTYMPAVLVNMLGHPGLGATRDERLRAVVLTGVPWIAAVLADYQNRLEVGTIDPSIPLNFNEVAGKVKADPHFLNRKQWRIDVATGSVYLL